MKNRWQMQQAKARLSEVVNLALTVGPQEITLHGKPVVVIVAKKTFEKSRKPKPSLVSVMQKTGVHELFQKIERDQSPPREVDL